ncbi:unnamed protein product [Blepharisma stoltei]|uniref:Myb-like DNA-binding domain containing protein n=1 Tax=Blepharisma stoltei TaxID=1481888 RepID=A0AAU9K0K0_9CILI|nr:unnamed protein product [Blepharisma stoltei]
MEWLPALENASDYWDSNFPIINSLCLEDTSFQTPAPLSNNATLNLSLSLEPRSISSSEFDESPAHSSTEEMPKRPELYEMNEIENLSKSNLSLNSNLAKNNVQFSLLKSKKNADLLEKKLNWSKEEDSLIFELYSKYGGNWKKIATFLPGRVPVAIKNRFYGTLKRRKNSPLKTEMDGNKNRGKSIFESNEPILYKGASWNEEEIIESFLMDPHQISNNLSPVKELEANVEGINLAEKKREELSAEGKRQKLMELYNKISTLETYISHTKKQIETIEVKVKASGYS